MIEKEKFFCICSIIVTLLLIYILYKDYKKKRKRTFEKLEIIPLPKAEFQIKEKSNILVIQKEGENFENNKEYFQAKNIDFVKIDNDENVWKYINYICETKNYEYICYLHTDLRVIDFSKDFKKLISQAGDNDMILCRDEDDEKMVSLKAVIFRNSDWTKYKLRQLYHKGEKYDIIMDQIYTNYNAGSVLSKKKFIDIGLPFICSGICVYNEHAFNSRKSSFIVNTKNREKDTIAIYPWNGISGFNEISKNLERLREWNGKRKIPKYIFQTMETTLISDDMNKYSRKRLKELNESYEYFYFDSLDCRKFIKDNFDDNVFKAYDKLLAGAYKADLFRYCLLYKYGGVYCDSNFMPLESFDSYIGDDIDFVIPDDVTHGLWQGFFAIKPKSELLKLTIDLTVKDILEDVYHSIHTGNFQILSITGPQKIGACFNLYLGFPISYIHSLGTHIHKKLKYKILNFSNHKNGSSRPFIVDKEKDKKIAINKFSDYIPVKDSFSLLSGKETYYSMFINRRIYKFKLI